MQGRIKVGAAIMQDSHFCRWPDCLPPKRHRNRVNPDMIFEVQWEGHYWNCKADGYGFMSHHGDIGDYGNGSIFVTNKEGVELVVIHVLGELNV